MKNDTCKEIICNGELLVLSAMKAAYWPTQQTLILADLHLGKSAYFRNQGIAIPSTIMLDDLSRLAQLIKLFPTQKIIVVGDMFHHSYNTDIQIFKDWRQQFNDLQIELVPGNHDKLLEIDYSTLNIVVTNTMHTSYPFVFMHEPFQATNEGFVISGHLHPGYIMEGRARQAMRLPCFIQFKNQLVLPAFSAFTGLFTNYERTEDCNYYVIGGTKIFHV